MTSRVIGLRPSGAATWVVCAGYVAFAAMYPEQPDETDTDVREDGTAAHWVASEVLSGRYPAVGSMSPNAREVTDEMHDGVDLYIDWMRRCVDAEWYVEQAVKCDTIYPGMAGTPDAWAYRPGMLRVVDFKYGFRFVEVWENWQLIVYAASLLATLQAPADTLVEMTIVQPRSNHRDGQVRTVTMTYRTLMPFIEKLRTAAVLAMGNHPQCTPNPGCVNCPGRHACLSLQNAAYQAIEVSYAATPMVLTPEQLGSELRWLTEAEKRIEARLTGLRAQGEQLARDGKQIPGWSLAATFARERYTEGTKAVVLGLGKLFGVNVSKPVEPLTPAQARKVLPQAAQAVLATLTHKPSTGVKLVKQDPYEARKRFQSSPTE